MLKIIESHYLDFLSKFHTERGVLQKMRKYIRKGERDETKERVELTKYVESASKFDTEATRKHLTDGVHPILLDEMDKLFEDLKFVIQEDDKLIRDIQKLKDALLRDLDRKALDMQYLAEHGKDPNSVGLPGKVDQNEIETYKHLVTVQINSLLKEFLNNLKNIIAQVAGRESLTVDRIKLIKDIGAQLQVVEADLVRARADLRAWQSAETTAKKYAYDFMQKTEVEAAKVAGIFDEHSNKSLVAALRALLNDMTTITQHIIIILEEKKQEAQNLLEGNGGQLDNVRPISVKDLKKPQPQGGRGYPLNVDLETRLRALLHWYDEQMSQYIGLLRIEPSKAEHEMLKAA